MESKEVISDIDLYHREARSIVDIAIANAYTTTEKYLNNGLSEDLDMKPQNACVENKIDYDATETTNVTWLTGADFTIERGKEKINEFVKTWHYNESWLFCIDFLSEEEYDCDTRYRYRVRWSIPTRRRPIPKATASVYFTIQVSKFKPKSFPVQVYYIFEANRLVHRPGESKFQQKWLKDIIDCKIGLLEDVKF